jgi:hypothetical protein
MHSHLARFEINPVVVAPLRGPSDCEPLQQHAVAATVQLRPIGRIPKCHSSHAHVCAVNKAHELWSALTDAPVHSLPVFRNKKVVFWIVVVNPFGLLPVNCSLSTDASACGILLRGVARVTVTSNSIQLGGWQMAKEFGQEKRLLALNIVSRRCNENHLEAW